MPSQVDLCNKALRRLGEDPIIALDNNSLWGRRCSAALPEVIRTILNMDVWTSCTKRVELAAESETPIGFNSAYPLPSDFIKLAAVRLGQYEDWSLEGNKILTKKDKTTPLEIMYVYEVTDPNIYSTALYDSIALGLAHELSGYSTATNVSKDDIYQLFAQTLITAQNINAKENPVKYLSTTSWVDARVSSLDKGLYDQYEGY